MQGAPMRCFSAFRSLMASKGGTKGTTAMLWTFLRVMAATASAHVVKNASVGALVSCATCVVDALQVGRRARCDDICQCRRNKKSGLGIVRLIKSMGRFVKRCRMNAGGGKRGGGFKQGRRRVAAATQFDGISAQKFG